MIPSRNKRVIVKELTPEQRATSMKTKAMVSLFRHKEILKKDILRKRALLEKELQAEIHVSNLNNIIIINNILKFVVFFCIFRRKLLMKWLPRELNKIVIAYPSRMNLRELHRRAVVVAKQMRCPNQRRL